MTGFLPVSTPDYLVVPPLAFGVGIQTTSFSKIEGIPLQQLLFPREISKRDARLGTDFSSPTILADKHAAKLYLAITLAFALGALCSAELEKICGIHTIWRPPLS